MTLAVVAQRAIAGWGAVGMAVKVDNLGGVAYASGLRGEARWEGSASVGAFLLGGAEGGFAQGDPLSTSLFCAFRWC